MIQSIGHGNDRKKCTGLYCIACYFSVEGLYHLYQYVNTLVLGDLRPSLVIASLVPIGLIVTAIGLFFRKRWGWNFAVFFNFYIFGNGLLNVARYFAVEANGSFIIKGAVSLLITASIFGYLLRPRIKEIFPKSPSSLFVLGFPLALCGIMQRTGNAMLDYFWLAMAIVGFAIVFKSGRQLIKHAWSDLP